MRSQCVVRYQSSICARGLTANGEDQVASPTAQSALDSANAQAVGMGLRPTRDSCSVQATCTRSLATASVPSREDEGRCSLTRTPRTRTAPPERALGPRASLPASDTNGTIGAALDDPRPRCQLNPFNSQHCSPYCARPAPLTPQRTWVTRQAERHDVSCPSSRAGATKSERISVWRTSPPSRPVHAIAPLPTSAATSAIRTAHVGSVAERR